MAALTVTDTWVQLPRMDAWIEEDCVRDLIPHYALGYVGPVAVVKSRSVVEVPSPVRAAPKLKARRNANRGTSYVIPEDVLVAAHAMHLEGMSLRGIAHEIFDDCFSASHKALVNALSGTFNARGWEVRPRVEATALANERRGFRPQCSHVHMLGERKGQRCERRCVGNDEWCWRHDPARIARSVEKLRALDAERRAA